MTATARPELVAALETALATIELDTGNGCQNAGALLKDEHGNVDYEATVRMLRAVLTPAPREAWAWSWVEYAGQLCGNALQHGIEDGAVIFDPATGPEVHPADDLMMDTVGDYLAKYEDRLDHEVDDVMPGRYVLLERNLRSGRLYITTHKSLAEAASYFDDQEYADEWEVVEVCDTYMLETYSAVRGATTFKLRTEEEN